MVAIALLSDFGVEEADELDLSGAWKLRQLSELPIGTVGVVESLDLPREIQHHLMHMGFVPEARVNGGAAGASGRSDGVFNRRV